MGARLEHPDQQASAFIPYTSHVTRNAVKLASGDYVQVIRLLGASHESADIAEINRWHENLNGMLRNVASPHVAFWTHTVRRKYNEYPAGEYPPGFARDLNERYKRHMANKLMLVNELYLTVVYRPHPNPASSMLEKLLARKEEQIINAQREELETLDDITDTVMSSLERFEPELLGCYEHRDNLFSEVLEFLGFLINGEWQRMPLPRAEIREMLTTARPYFGQTGTMALQGATSTQYAAILCIQEYPDLTCPGLLNDLMVLPFEMTVSQSFAFLPKQAAISRMKAQIGRMTNAGDLSASQIEDLEGALDDLVSNRFVMGTHSLAIVVKAEDPKILNKYVGDAGAVFAESGMKWAREDSGMAGAFYAQLPGNFAYRPRLGDITSRNFAGFSSFHNYPIGRIRGNQWGDAVTMLETTSGSPMYFSFHQHTAESRKIAALDPDHKDLANAVIIGKSGVGKTALEMFLLAQLTKFDRPDIGQPMTAILFDKDNGCSNGVRALGGLYYPLKNGVPTGFAPFKLEPTPRNITFLVRLVRRLVKHTEMPLTPAQDKQIVDAINGVMSASWDKRRLSSVLEFFDPTDENGLYPRLAKWCRGGPLGWLFDNDADTLSLNGKIIGFDVTDFLDNEDTRTPTIMYLFHRIDSLIDGRRLPIFMDEFWKLLKDEEFEDLAHNKLVTIRKQNGFLVMITTAPKQVLTSPIAFAIVEQTATKIFLPNPEADKEDYVDGFKLTEREYEIISKLPENSRRFLIKQGHNSVVAELNLRDFKDELAILSSNTHSAALVENLAVRYGNDPNKWIPEFHRIRKGG